MIVEIIATKILINVLHAMMQVIFDVIMVNVFREVFDGKFEKYLRNEISFPLLLSNHRNDCRDGSDENPATCGK
jgi:hypothetical protein